MSIERSHLVLSKRRVSAGWLRWSCRLYVGESTIVAVHRQAHCVVIFKTALRIPIYYSGWWGIHPKDFG